MRKCGTIFRQSLADFPLSVELGKNIPDWKLSRWNGDKGLRFIPLDDEGFSLRGNRKQLLYKGRRRSHRFTILGDGAFEYDCILEKEPESNVVSLLMDGAEQYDFFRQPDFVSDDFLKGSYAVYKKEILIGQGTGKLCHIHKPLIIDARGRKVWGDLSVVGNELRITIPAEWLAEAKYPVVVDPTVGTTTIGSQWQYYNDDYDPEYPEDEPEYKQIFNECSIDVSKFIVPEAINGSCTAYFYAMKDRTYDETYCGGRPVFYSDQNNKPVARKSKQENLINFYINTINNEGWRSGTFASNEIIPAGSNIWFGCFAAYFWFYRFDYGSLLYSGSWYSNTTIDTVPDLFNTWYPWQQSQKVSMYFTYTSAQNYVRTLTQGVRLTDTRNNKTDYKRLSTQTIRITDARSNKADYKRTAAQTAKATDLLKGSVSFVRSCIFNAVNSVKLTRFPTFYRSAKDETRLTDFLKNNRGINRIFTETARINENIKKEQVFLRGLLQNISITDSRKHITDYKRETKETVNGKIAINNVISFFRLCVINAANITGISRIPAFFRFVSDDAKTTAGIKNNREIYRRFEDTAITDGLMKRSQGFYRSVTENIKGTDNAFYPVVFIRTVKETQSITDTFSKLGNYFRGLYVEAGNIAETVRWGNYYRTETDIVQAEGSVIRQLFIFIKLVSTSLVRDFVLRRFLIAREELVLKSCITRELTLDSKIN